MISGDMLTVLSGEGAQLFTLNLASHSVEYDRTGGAAAPWADRHDATTGGMLDELEPDSSRIEVGAGPGFGERFGELELERPDTVESRRYQSFEKHGQSLARERTSSGRLFRLVRFDADTLYLLFRDQDEPTVVLRGEVLDVRGMDGAPIFRAHLRTLEPIVSRRTAVEDTGLEEEPEIERDPLLVTGAVDMTAAAAPPRLHRVLSRAVWAGASDIHVRSGAPVEIRLHGRLEPFEGLTFSASEIEAMLLEVLTEEQRKHFLETSDLDFSYDLPNVGRFRANLCRQHRGVDGTFRAIPTAIPSLGALGLPSSVPALTKHHQGLVLITGPAGQGKSTTIAALVDLVNTEKALHVITVEDPIEFVHPIKRAIVNQREVGRHTLSFANALRAALREDPDVIVVGEMRDLETISLAITAAETGHLVFGTLMTMSASQTIDRILDSFPAGQQAQIRTMLSESLKGIVSQQLVPTVEGNGRVLACEVLLGTPAVGNLIRERKTFQLPSVMQTGRNLGMQRMDDSLAELVQAGRITPEKAMQYAHDPKAFDSRFKPRPAPELTGAKK
jgi:twitching motility protein PilT